MQLLETTIFHRILETLNWTRHHPHEEGNTTEPGSPRTAETAQLNGTAGGHRNPAKKNLQGVCLLYSTGAFCKHGRCRVGRDRAQTSRAAFGTKRTFLTANPFFLMPLLLGLMFTGGLGRPSAPNRRFQSPNVPPYRVI